MLPGSFSGGSVNRSRLTGRNPNQTDGGTAALDPANIASLQPWQDATYQQATRALDPQFQQAEARFNQDLINRGIAQGSEAYTAARSDFDRARNDAYGSARNQALAQALAAQQQGFGQSYSLDQLASQNAATDAQALGASLDREFRNRDFTEGTRRWDLSRGDGLDQQDFQNMTSLMGFDFGTQQFDAGQQQQDYNNQLPFFGLVPNQGPSQIDTYSPYNLQAQQQSNNAANRTNQQNGTMGAIGTIAGVAAMAF
jgi:hypothetical protein